jgi:hypothetical protein
VPARVSPTEAVRAEIDELFGSGRDIAEVLEEVMRLSARLVLQQVLEDEAQRPARNGILPIPKRATRDFAFAEVRAARNHQWTRSRESPKSLDQDTPQREHSFGFR